MQYESRFGLWDHRASVRTKPRRTVTHPDPGQLYFSPELFPAATHPTVMALGEGAFRSVLLQRLYQYLHFTSELEAAAVLPVAASLGRGTAGIRLPAQMRSDAFKIATDEAWHSQFSFDLVRQLEASTGIAACELNTPAFLTRMDRIRDAIDPSVRGAERLMFAVVSETLISSILADLPRDRRLPAAVREVVRDHAEDEGRHHAFFRTLLKFYWQALDPRDRRLIGVWIPEMIVAFLAPDKDAHTRILKTIGLDDLQANAILEDCLPDSSLMKTVRPAAAATIRHLGDVGAFDDPQILAAFVACGLIEV